MTDTHDTNPTTPYHTHNSGQGAQAMGHGCTNAQIRKQICIRYALDTFHRSLPCLAKCQELLLLLFIRRFCDWIHSVQGFGGGLQVFTALQLSGVLLLLLG